VQVDSQYVMSELTTTYEWKDIPWRKLERKNFKLQKRIYQASRRGDVTKVRKLQRLLMKSRSAKLLAVRRVTQENKGKKTAGIDGVKSLTPKQRLELTQNLRLTDKAKPTRRVWIPKPGREEKRPLGIPVMYDRALQALVKLALEPEWEARFEPNSYGFRPGRSCHDAINAIWHKLKMRPKWVLDADIAKCFDRIDHKALLLKINTSPNIRRQLRAWLKAGVMDDFKYFDTNEGTPQGGVISPLLANIALHGMENRITQAFKQAKVIRYADDFVILHDDLEVIHKCKTIIEEWLQGMGLELKDTKTRITHSLEGGKEHSTGFDFLGFNIRQIQVGKYQTRTPGKGFDTLITPSKEKVKSHAKKLAQTIGSHKSASQSDLIKLLNPQIRGWANYYRTGNSKKTYTLLDNLLYLKLKRWTERRHPNKNKSWCVNRYWEIEEKGWRFVDKRSKSQLLKYADTKVKSPMTKDQYVKIQGDRSPYDGDWAYWATRMGEHPELPKRVSYLLKQQKGKCPHCGLRFTPDSQMEIHHKDINHKNNKWENLELLHLVCHDQVHGEQNHDDGTQEWVWENDIPYPSPNPKNGKRYA
jgi:RNA-directed DNA polymerase